MLLLVCTGNDACRNRKLSIRLHAGFASRLLLVGAESFSYFDWEVASCLKPEVFTLSSSSTTDRVTPIDRPGDPRSFFHVKNLVADAGLTRRRPGHYLVLVVVLLLLLGGTIAGVVLLRESWFQLLMAGSLGLILTQFAFLAHEAAHRQILSMGKSNDKLGRFLANYVVGISYQWWMNKHSKHHATPNTIGKDPDISWDTISFVPAGAQRQRGLLKWITERQGYLFFPLLSLEGLNLHYQSLRYLLTGSKVKQRRRELVSVIARVVLYIAVIFAFLPLGMAFAFVAVQLVVFGIYMGASFAPNHKGMPMVPKDAKAAAATRQARMCTSKCGVAGVTQTRTTHQRTLSRSSASRSGLSQRRPASSQQATDPSLGQ